MPAFCLKQNVDMNFEYIWSFKTFLSGTAKYHKTGREGWEGLRKKRLWFEDWEKEARRYECEKKKLGRMLCSNSEKGEEKCVENGIEVE
jgi:hypothetical protein